MYMQGYNQSRQATSSTLSGYQQKVLLFGCGLLTALLLLVRYCSPVPIANMTRDPLVAAKAPFYLGFFSNIGVMLWCFTAAVCLFSSLLLLLTQKQRDMMQFFAVFGVLNTWLMIDDWLTFHEQLERLVPPLSEKLTFSVYAALVLFSLCRFRKIWLKTQPYLLGLSLLLFVISILIDVAIPTEWFAAVDDEYLLEDGTKLLAIFVWTVYFWRIGLEAITRLIQLPGSTRPLSQ
ncbi:MAG: hypothetical protein F6J97_01920 [Leptolyngbya sp. SIO4C1]|nr:hypothetical protein [Leptolyngbya sp. SIO4C1]